MKFADAIDTMLYVVVVVFIFLGLRELSFTDPVAFWINTVALIVVVVYLLLTSVYLIAADKMVVSIFLGTYRATYISGTFAKSEDVKGKLMSKRPMAHRGILGSDIVVLLWPLWRVRIFPTTENVLRVHASRVYTKDDGEKSPSVPILVDTTVVFQLGPDLGPFIQAFPVLDGPLNLAKTCNIRDNMFDPKDPGNYKHVYQSTELARIVLEIVQTNILEKVRTVGAQHPWMGDNNIKGHIEQFENEIKEALAESEAAFVRGGLLEAKTGNIGPSATAFDFNVEDIDLEDEETRKALGQPLIGILEGTRKGNYYKKIQEESGIPAREVLVAETLDKSEGDLNIYTAGEGLLNVFAPLLGRLKQTKKKPKKKSP
ncbi:MAG: hypothetical protein WEA04_03295 [Candidatus Andersenbacteria bacterium]